MGEVYEELKKNLANLGASVRLCDTKKDTVIVDERYEYCIPTEMFRDTDKRFVFHKGKEKFMKMIGLIHS